MWNHTKNFETIAMIYANLCKLNNIEDVITIINSFKEKQHANIDINIDINTNINVHDVAKIKAAFDVFGEKPLIEIANRLCKNQSTFQLFQSFQSFQSGGSIENKSGNKSENLTQDRKKSFDERLTNLSTTADKSVVAAEKLADSAEKLANTAIKITEAGTKIGTAFVGLYNAVKLSKSKSKSIDANSNSNATKDPVSDVDVLKNIKYLEDQIKSKDVQIIEIAKETKLLVSQLRYCNNKIKNADQNINQKNTEATLKAKIIQLESQINNLKAKHALEITNLKKQQITPIKNR